VKKFVVGVFMVMDKKWLKFVVHQLFMQQKENRIKLEENEIKNFIIECFVNYRLNFLRQEFMKKH